MLVEDGRVSGLLDIDGAGPIERVEDLANLIGHLSTLALWRPEARSRLETYTRELTGAFDAVADPVELRRRTAAVVLGLATAPFRLQRPKWKTETKKHFTLVEKWLALSQSGG